MVRSSLDNPRDTTSTSDSSNQKQADCENPCPPSLSMKQNLAWEDSTDEREREHIKREEKDLKAQETMADGTEKLVTYTRWSVALSFIAVLASIGVAWWSFREARRIHRESLNHAAESETRQQDLTRMDMRAYLTVDIEVIDCHALNAANGGGGKNPPEEGMYRIIFKNAGRTPAHNISYYGIIITDKWPNPNASNFVVKEPKRLNLSLGPGLDSNIGAYVESPINFSGINKRERAIYIFGRFIYFDVLNNLCTTNFCFLHRLDRSGLFTDTIESHDQWNDIT